MEDLKIKVIGNHVRREENHENPTELVYPNPPSGLPVMHGSYIHTQEILLFFQDYIIVNTRRRIKN